MMSIPVNSGFQHTHHNRGLDHLPDVLTGSESGLSPVGNWGAAYSLINGGASGTTATGLLAAGCVTRAVAAAGTADGLGLAGNGASV
jgi:hypothetical protein